MRGCRCHHLGGVNMEWKSINNLPDKSGYVLLAGYHHNIPTVLQGYCKLNGDGTARYEEERYTGTGVTITHWMPLPEHPTVIQEG